MKAAARRGESRSSRSPNSFAPVPAGTIFISRIENSMSRWILVFPLLLASAQTPVQQEMTLKAVPYYPKPATTIRAETNLVDIGVVVRDAGGHPMSGLTKADFVVRDEGRERRS